MVNEKMQLSSAYIDSQVAFELPERETLALVTVVITNLLNNNSVDIKVSNNNVAVQVCAAVSAIRRPPHEGQKPRHLHENGTIRSSPQASQ